MFSKIIIGFLIVLLFTGIGFALRIESPPVLDLPLDENEINRLNNYLDQIWNITNGKISLDITTTAPNGNRGGSKGEMVLYNSSGTYSLWVNTTGAKVWQQL